jgi:hypothetical protein
LGNVWQFDREGIYPSGISSKNGFLAPKPLYNQLNAVFRSAIDHHFAFGGMHGKQEKTVWVEVRATMNFSSIYRIAERKHSMILKTRWFIHSFSMENGKSGAKTIAA